MPSRSLTLMLPQPPSSHALWGRGKGGRLFRSDAYNAWLREADGVAMQQHAFRHRQPIDGDFALDLALSSACKLDIDNPVKAILDWAQGRSLTGNDRHCRELHVSFRVDIETGWVVVTLAPLAKASESLPAVVSHIS